MLNINHQATKQEISLLIAPKTTRVAMILHEDYGALVQRMREILSELDRLQLPMVAVHVDLALDRLEKIIAGASPSSTSDQN